MPHVPYQPRPRREPSRQPPSMSQPASPEPFAEADPLEFPLGPEPAAARPAGQPRPRLPGGKLGLPRISLQDPGPDPRQIAAKLLAALEDDPF